jgi:hypothetical protein
MKKISTTQFKSRCLELIDEVQRTRRPLRITCCGKTVAEVVPPRVTALQTTNPLKASVVFQGDLISPISQAWDCERS